MLVQSIPDKEYIADKPILGELAEDQPKKFFFQLREVHTHHGWFSESHTFTDLLGGKMLSAIYPFRYGETILIPDPEGKDEYITYVIRHVKHVYIPERKEEGLQSGFYRIIYVERN